MASLSATPAALNLACTVANDFTLTLAVTENGSNWSSTGATLATSIYDSSGTAVATNFTSSATDGNVTLTLTDTETSTLGVGVYSYRLSVTKSSNTRTWIAGTLSVVEPGVGGRSASASLTLTTSTVTLTLTSLVAPAAANISVADAGGYYTGDTVEEVLAEVMETPSTTTRRLVELATNAEALSRTDTERAVTPANLSQFLTLARHNGQYFLPTAAVAQTTSRLDVISNGSPLSSGRLSFHLMWIPAGTINSITFVSANTAASTPTNQWFAIYDATTRTKLAVTNDDTTTAWPTHTAKTLTISGGVELAEGLYYVGIMVAAAAVPSLYAVSFSASTAINNLPPIITGADTTNVGLTTPATAPTTAAALTPSTIAPYAYVS